MHVMYTHLILTLPEVTYSLFQHHQLPMLHRKQLCILIVTSLVNLQGASAPKHFWDVWQLFNLGDPKGILWSALPRQLPTVLALAFVVAFGSSLDVAAIQQGSSDELDYNRELVTVGMQQLSCSIIAIS